MRGSQHSIDWYFGNDAKTMFEQSSLQQRVHFVLEYLSKLSNPTYTEAAEQKMCEMRCYYFALFLVDAIYDAPLPYSKYPACIDPKQNPFLNYWNEAKDVNAIDANVLRRTFVKILQNADSSTADCVKAQIRNIGEQEGLSVFYNSALAQMPMPDVLTIAPELLMIEQKIHWLCDKLACNDMIAPCQPVVEVNNGKKLFFVGVIAAVILVVIAIATSIFAPIDRSNFVKDTDGRKIELSLVNWEDAQAPLTALDLSIENDFDRDLAGLTIELHFYDSDDKLIHTTTLPLSGYMAAHDEKTLNVKLHDAAVEDLYWYSPEEIGITAEITEINFNDTYDAPVKNGKKVLKEAEKPDESKQDAADKKLDAAFKIFDAVDINGVDFEQKTAEFGAALDEIWEDVIRSDALSKKVYNKAAQYETDKEYEKAYMLFSLLASVEYKDSETRAYNCALAAGSY